MSDDQVWSTIGKLQRLLQETDLEQSQFAALCDLYNLGVSQALISRALRDGKFSKHETDQRLRPLILRIEDLVKCAGLFKISYKDAQYIKFLLDLIADGHRLSAQILLTPTKKDSNGGTQ